MKKIILIGIFALTSLIAFPQAGLKIASAIPTDKGMVTNVNVKFGEFYLNNQLKSQFAVYTQSMDGVDVKTFDVMPVYNFQLSAIPTITVMWDSVKAVLVAKGLTVVNIP